MSKRLSAVVAFFLISQVIFAQVQSPEKFLGYKVGTRYTPHWKIIEYFKSVASAIPSMVKLQQYGVTNEGRPLLVALVSSASNISNAESIRLNNLRIAASSGDNSQANVSSAPAIVWLSYNVHGNETSSSEAAMATLWELVDPSNARTKQWLQNTVVIIDPCLNPDGRDRYVNWFNSIVGNNPNPSLDAREHREPWPGGRTNHYNFDLNRDWAWQTQVESQQRIPLYNQWLPHVHVDFHEQGINNPYYFAPAAEPYHEVITKWQRDFQNTIGRNHARYFDKAGWLYFTREVFDLLYPSYGDTYPVYNGSIGMTYEQAGGPAGGATAITSDGDTLTLHDRMLHHLTTGLSTIEVASQNAPKLVSEFQKYFNEAVTSGIGNYKTYVVKYNDRDAERIHALADLLKKNNIRYGTGKTAVARGFNYDTHKDESFSISPNDMIIPGIQPKSALVKVLFEPNAALVDSNTYDITAWSLPYVYGVRSFATTQRIDFSNSGLSRTVMNTPAADPYAYVIRWNGMQTVRLVSQLLQKGIRLRYSEQAFETGGESFDPGAVMVLKTSNQYFSNLWETVRDLANKYQVPLTAVSSGFVDRGYDFGSSKVRPLKSKRVALITGEGINSNAAGEVWHFFDNEIKYPVTLVLNDPKGIKWDNYDVVVMPEGNYRFLADKAQAEVFRNWIQGGGQVVALSGAVGQLSKFDWVNIKPKKTNDSATRENEYAALRKYEDRDRDFIPDVTPGSIFKVELDNTHPLAFGYPKHYFTLKQDDAIYQFIKTGGWNVGVLKKDRQVSGFVGSRLTRRLQDGLLFGVQEIGNGSITYLVDDVLFRSFWENGKLMFANAVFLVGE